MADTERRNLLDREFPFFVEQQEGDHLEQRKLEVTEAADKAAREVTPYSAA